MDDYSALVKDLGHLARLALGGRRQDIELYVRRLSRRYRTHLPELSTTLSSLLRDQRHSGSPLRSATVASVPVDTDTRLPLVRHEHAPNLAVEPIWSEDITPSLDLLIRERRHEEDLQMAGLSPTRTALFTGPPGVGKTLAARWLARELELPLVILDLSAVISSFLGRTGTNLRHVLDYAKGTRCILLMDELDAVAKRRDDLQEVGELKRLVTVLLQEIDDWPPTGLLLAATNHSDLLDPAVWRRFDSVIRFPLPEEVAIRRAIRTFLEEAIDLPKATEDFLTNALKGSSFSDIERLVMKARRHSAISKEPLVLALQQQGSELVDSIPSKDKISIALQLVMDGTSQREANRLTGVSRDTIRKRLHP